MFRKILSSNWTLVVLAIGFVLYVVVMAATVDRWGWIVPYLG